MSKLCLNINGHLIQSIKHVKLLGINIDNSLKFEAHVKELYRKVSLIVHAFGKITTIFRRTKLKVNFILRGI